MNAKIISVGTALPAYYVITQGEVFKCPGLLEPPDLVELHLNKKVIRAGYEAFYCITAICKDGPDIKVSEIAFNTKVL